MLFISMGKFPIYKLRITETDTETGVEYIALVDSPAIEKNFMAFDSFKELFQVKNQEQRIVSGALMVANLPIYRRDEQYGEYFVVFDKETISKIVHKFFKKKNTANVNLMHDPSKKVEDVYMFESFIIDRTKGINPPAGFEKLPDGSWFGSFKVNNDEVWEQIKAGEFKGFSVEGIFQHEFVYDSETVFIDNLREVLLKELNKDNASGIYNKDRNIMELKINEKIKEKMAQIKALFTDVAEVVMTDAKLKDGTTIISYEGETPIAGAKVFTVDENGKTPIVDGDYELEDGTILVCKDGVIMDVKKAEAKEGVKPAPVEEVKSAEVAELKASIENIKKESEKAISEFKAELKKANDFNKSLFEIIESITNIPDVDPTKKPATPFSISKDRTSKILELSKHLQTIKK